ncbi:MAG: porin [Burkholderiaceae bacterium]|nr:porin [Burkholderiaceae bacterium]
MAAVAVAGAATAQVSVTGALGFGWEGVSPAVDGSTTGIKVTDGNVKFSASEDLGGGMSVLTAMDIQSRGRDTTIAGRDASITLVTGFGGFTLGAVEAGNGILGLGGAGAPVIGLDGNTAGTGSGVLDGGVNVNIAKDSLPLGNGIGISLSRVDSAAALKGLNAGNVYGATYSMNAISAAFDYTDTAMAKRTRVSGSYDLGVVKLGAGYQTRKFTGATSTNKQTVLGVSAPYGAFTFGLNYATQKQLEASNKGIHLGVSYALSKRTNVYAQMQRLTIGDLAVAKTTRVKMVTSF